MKQNVVEKALWSLLFSPHQRSRHFCFRLVLTGRPGVRNNSIFVVQMIVAWMDVTQWDVTTVNLANTKCRWLHEMNFFAPGDVP